MPTYVKIASVKDIHEQSGKLVSVGDEDVAVFRREGKFFAVSNVCAHQHFSVLHRGLLEGCTVTCPMHGWMYDLRTGKATTGQGRVMAYKIQVEGDDVLVEMP